MHLDSGLKVGSTATSTAGFSNSQGRPLPFHSKPWLSTGHGRRGPVGRHGKWWQIFFCDVGHRSDCDLCPTCIAEMPGR